MEKIREITKETIENLKLRQEELRKVSFEIRKIFFDILKNEKVTITDRIKSENSLREKIVRKSLHKKFSSGKELVDSLDDIIGIRIVCLLHEEEESIFGKLKLSFEEKDKCYVKKIEKNEIKLEKIILPVVQKNNHPIYKISGSYIKNNLIEYKFELQIKSSVHMLWGEIEHMLFYKNYEYNIGKNFYTVIMDSIYNNLLEIDKQLSKIKDEILNNKNSFQEIKRILARMLYTKLKNVIKEFFDFEIDLTDYYDSIIEIKLKDFDINSFEDFHGNVSKIMSYINDIESKTLIQFIEKDSFENLKLNSEDKELKNKIKKIIKEKNKEIYFRIFNFLFLQGKEKKDAENILEEITTFYFKNLVYDIDEIENRDEIIDKDFAKNTLNNYILCTIRDRNISWPIKNSHYIREIVDNHLDIIASIDIEDIDEDKKDTLSNIITELLILKTNIDNKFLISKESLEKILEKIKEMDSDIFTSEFINEFNDIVNKFESKKDISKKLKKRLSTGGILSNNEEVNFYNEE